MYQDMLYRLSSVAPVFTSVLMKTVFGGLLLAWVVITILGRYYRQWKIYKLLMGKHAKPYVPKENDAASGAGTDGGAPAPDSAPDEHGASEDEAVPEPDDAKATPAPKSDGTGAEPVPEDGAKPETVTDGKQE